MRSDSLVRFHAEQPHRHGNEKQRGEIASQVEDFLAKGGKIQHCESIDNSGARMKLKTDKKGVARYVDESAEHLAYSRKGGQRSRKYAEEGAASG